MTGHGGSRVKGSKKINAPNGGTYQDKHHPPQLEDFLRKAQERREARAAATISQQDNTGNEQALLAAIPTRSENDPPRQSISLDEEESDDVLANAQDSNDSEAESEYSGRSFFTQSAVCGVPSPSHTRESVCSAKTDAYYEFPNISSKMYA